MNIKLKVEVERTYISKNKKCEYHVKFRVYDFENFYNYVEENNKTLDLKSLFSSLSNDIVDKEIFYFVNQYLDSIFDIEFTNESISYIGLSND